MKGGSYIKKKDGTLERVECTEAATGRFNDRAPETIVSPATAEAFLEAAAADKRNEPQGGKIKRRR